MANTLITPELVAREALLQLTNNLILGGLVHRDFSNEFANKGDTVMVRRPATFTAQPFTTGPITVQDATEGYVEVQLDTLLDVSFAIGAKELTLSVDDFSRQFIQPAVLALAQAVDAKIAELYKNVPYVAPVGSTPAVSDLSAVVKVMNQNKVPMTERRLVLDPTAHAAYVALEQFLSAEKRGDTEALREASLGRLLGLDVYMSQNIKTHTSGTLAGTATATGTAGDTSITIASGGASKTLVAGDIISIATVPGTYVVTANTSTDSSGNGSADIYPALAADCSGKTITLIGTHVANLAFHRNAFALVTRPLAKPLGAQRSEVISWQGLSVRVVYDYDPQYKRDIVSLDVLCGVKTLQPELAVRFYDV